MMDASFIVLVDDTCVSHIAIALMDVPTYLMDELCALHSAPAYIEYTMDACLRSRAYLYSCLSVVLGTVCHQCVPSCLSMQCFVPGDGR